MASHWRGGLVGARAHRSPRYDLDFDAVLLDVRARRREQAAVSNDAGLVILAPVVKGLPIRRFAQQRPRLAEHLVDENLKQ